jgi:hypothetical protein
VVQALVGLRQRRQTMRRRSRTPRVTP